jgi:hypothetical protein
MYVVSTFNYRCKVLVKFATFVNNLLTVFIGPVASNGIGMYRTAVDTWSLNVTLTAWVCVLVYPVPLILLKEPG